MTPPIAVVTGATGGIGRHIALGLARAGHHVVLVGRSAERGAAAQAWIAAEHSAASTELVLADLSLVSATRAAAANICARHPAVALLVNNAGAFDATQVMTAEGHDRVFATNLLSPFALTQGLLPALQDGARVVTVGSSTSDTATLDPAHLELGDRWSMVKAYGQSKLAVMMATFAFADQLRGSGVTANVVHPGMVATGLVRTGGVIGMAWRLLAIAALTEAQGADTPLYAATAPELADVTGVYLKKRRPVRPNRRALDRAENQRVWDETARIVAAH